MVASKRSWTRLNQNGVMERRARIEVPSGIRASFAHQHVANWSTKTTGVDGCREDATGGVQATPPIHRSAAPSTSVVGRRHRMSAKPIRDGFHTVTPYLFATGAARLIRFLTEAFNAQLVSRKDRPDGA